jgi:hypothetical protein
MENGVDSEVMKLREKLLRRKNEKLKKVRELNLKLGNEKINIKDFDIHAIEPDGNCFYRCVARKIKGSESYHVKIREQLSEHMRKNKPQYSMYVDGDYEIHIRNHERYDGRVVSWATEAEIVATSNLFSMLIVLIRVEAGNVSAMRFKPHSSVNVKNENDILYILLENNHFSYLEKRKTNHNWQESNMVNQDDNYYHNSFDWFEMRNERGVDSTVRNTSSTAEHRINHRNVTSEGPRSVVTNEKNQDMVKKGKQQRETVTDQSSRGLTQDEISLLSKGFSFIPTRVKFDMTKLHSDLIEWERRMRLHEYFYDRDDNNEHKQQDKSKPWLKKESFFTPGEGRDPWLDAYIEEVKGDIIDGIQKNISKNLTTSEQHAMRSLLSDNSIIIRPADKGSGVVVMDTDVYIKELEKEVSKDETFKQTNGEKQSEAVKAVKKVANKLFRDGEISKELRDYLIPKFPTSGRLKGNPKVHKNGMPYRTIVSGIGTPTERMAEVAEKELNEFVEASPSYIRDTTDFLNKLQVIPTTLDNHIILFCFDIVKLYPSIPRQEGLQACLEALENRENKWISSDAVMRMIETVLDNNVFQFRVRSD